MSLGWDDTPREMRTAPAEAAAAGPSTPPSNRVACPRPSAACAAAARTPPRRHPGLQKQPVRREMPRAALSRVTTRSSTIRPSAPNRLSATVPPRAAPASKGPEHAGHREVVAAQRAQTGEQLVGEGGDVGVHPVDAEAVDPLQPGGDVRHGQEVHRAVLEGRLVVGDDVPLRLRADRVDRATGEPGPTQLGEGLPAGDQTADAGGWPKTLYQLTTVKSGWNRPRSSGFVGTKAAASSRTS